MHACYNNVHASRGPMLGEISYALPEITEIILQTEIRNHRRQYLIMYIRFPLYHVRHIHSI